MIVTKTGKTFLGVEVLKKNPESLDISYYRTPDANYKSVTTIPFSDMTEKYQKLYGYNSTPLQAPKIDNLSSIDTSLQKTTNDETLQQNILKYGKPMIVKSGSVHNLNGQMSKKSREFYKKTVFWGYGNYILDDNEIYICSNCVDAKNYLVNLNKEIHDFKKEHKIVLSEVSNTEDQIKLLNNKLTELQDSHATRTFKSETGQTLTVSYDQTEINNCIKDIEFNKEKLNYLYNSSNVTSIIDIINSKETEYKDYTNSLAKLEKTYSNTTYNSYFNSIVVIITPNSMGSGFFISKDGYIITNEHVVKDAATVKLLLHDKTSLLAHVIEVNKEKDLALLKAIGNNFSALDLEDTDNIEIGDDVIAIGTPKGLEWTITKGIVSAIRNEKGTEVIQTDVATNPGNSGGPLISIKTGKVVGIIRSGISNSQGLNFAIAPSEIFKAFPKLNSTIKFN